jgi:transcriptional regulator with XRE-family HTH domain
MKKYGKRIKQLRKARGWSQRDLARAAQMHPPTVSQIESGKTTLWPGYAARIAKALGVSIEEVTS